MSLLRSPYIIGSHAYFFREGDAILSVIATASRARNNNVATIITPTPHGLWTGALVTIAGLGGIGYNAAGVAVTVVNATTFSYANAGANEGTQGDVAGTVTLTGVCSASVKPGPNDASWITLGVIEDSSMNREGNDIEIYAPSPGKIVLHDVLRNKHKLTAKLTCQEWGPFVQEVLMLTEPLTEVSTQYNPLEGPDKKGWIKFQRYDQNDAIREILDLWGRLSIAGDVQFGGSDIVKPQFEFLALHSSLNTGTL